MPSELGTFIREQRKLKGFKLREFARIINRSAPYLTQLELDDQPPVASEETLLAIGNALGINPDELFALARRLPKDLRPESAQEVALFRKVKEMSLDDQRRLLEG